MDGKHKIINTSIYDFGWRPLDGWTDAGGDEDLTAHDILMIGKQSRR